MFLNVSLASSRLFPHDGLVAKGGELQRTGRAVAARRGQLGMTQQELADAAHVDLKTIYNLESGTRWPIARNRAAISAALGWEGDALAQIADSQREGRAGAAPLAVVPPPPPGDPPGSLGMNEEYARVTAPRLAAIRARVDVVRSAYPDLDVLPGSLLFPGDDWSAWAWDRMRAGGLGEEESMLLLAQLRTDDQDGGREHRHGNRKSGTTGLILAAHP